LKRESETTTRECREQQLINNQAPIWDIDTAFSSKI